MFGGLRQVSTETRRSVGFDSDLARRLMFQEPADEAAVARFPQGVDVRRAVVEPMHETASVQYQVEVLDLSIGAFEGDDPFDTSRESCVPIDLFGLEHIQKLSR